MKPPKKSIKPEPDRSGMLAGWTTAGLALLLIMLVIYVNKYGR